MKWIVALFLFTMTVLTMRTLFTPGFFRPHDFIHVARLSEMRDSLAAGELPVRWSQNFGFGYGMPLFSFYGPTPYYVASAFHFSGLSLIDSIKALYVLNAVAAFLGMYVLVKEIWGRHGALVAACVFSLSTYRAVDLFVRGALGEVTAMVAIPFALYGVMRIIHGKQYGIAITAVALALSITSHNLTGMIAFGLTLVFAVGMTIASSKRSPNKIIFSCVLALIFGVMLSAWYTVPAFFEKDATRVEEATTGGDFDIHYHFVIVRQLLFSSWGYGGSIVGIHDGMSFALGWASILMVGVGCVSIVLFDDRRGRRILIVLVLLFAGSLYMTTKYSVFIWEAIPLLSYFQFPWRFLVFAHIFLAMIAGGVRKKSMVSIVLVSAVVISQYGFFAPEKILRGEELTPYYCVMASCIQGPLSQTLHDYIPQEIHDLKSISPVSDRIIPLDGGEVFLATNHPSMMVGRFSCENDDCLFRVNIFRFPGWEATGEAIAVRLTPASDFPVYELRIPRGEHTVTITLVDTPIRMISNTISLSAFIGLCVFLLWKVRSSVYNE